MVRGITVSTKAEQRTSGVQAEKVRILPMTLHRGVSDLPFPLKQTVPSSHRPFCAGVCVGHLCSWGHLAQLSPFSELL